MGVSSLPSTLSSVVVRLIDGKLGEALCGAEEVPRTWAIARTLGSEKNAGLERRASVGRAQLPVFQVAAIHSGRGLLGSQRKFSTSIAWACSWPGWSKATSFASAVALSQNGMRFSTATVMVRSCAKS